MTLEDFNKKYSLAYDNLAEHVMIEVNDLKK